jgi:hypothetical protein
VALLQSSFAGQRHLAQNELETPLLADMRQAHLQTRLSFLLLLDGCMMFGSPHYLRKMK